jgi:hypothetical protein
LPLQGEYLSRVTWNYLETEMAESYTVRQGDHLSKIAKAFGFSDYHTIWDHPNNGDLKQKRQNPNVLLPATRYSSQTASSAENLAVRTNAITLRRKAGSSGYV